MKNSLLLLAVFFFMITLLTFIYSKDSDLSLTSKVVYAKTSLEIQGAINPDQVESKNGLAIKYSEMLNGKIFDIDNFTIQTQYFQNQFKFILTNKEKSLFLTKALSPNENVISFKDNQGETKLIHFIDDTKKVGVATSYIIKIKGDPISLKAAKLLKEIEEKEERLELFKEFGIAYNEIYKIENELGQLKQNLKPNIQDYSYRLNSLHNVARRDISRILDEPVEKSSDNDFLNIFNGVVISAKEEEITKIERLPYVEKVYKDEEVRMFLSDTVPFLDIPEIWQLKDNLTRNITGEGIKVAVLDTGIDYTHPDLGGCTTIRNCSKVIGGFDFVNFDEDPIDDNGHGTHVAGIIAGTANMSEGFYMGAASSAKLLAYKVLNAGGSGSLSGVIAGIEAAVRDEADILSISLGGPGDPDHPLAQAVDNAVDSGVTVVVAAGNRGRIKSIGTPGTARKSITVGATDKNDKLASYSSRGPVEWNGNLLLKPDLLAPGGVYGKPNFTSNNFTEIVSAFSPNVNKDPKLCFYSDFWTDECRDDEFNVTEWYIRAAGTSMATPHVSGVAALLLQAHPDWTPEIIKSALMLASEDLNLTAWEQGSGRINPLKAINVPIATFPQSINFGFQASDSFWQEVTIENLKNEEIVLSLNSTNIKDEFGNGYSRLTMFNTSLIVIPPQKSVTINFTIANTSNIEGLLYGHVLLNRSDEIYRIPYLFSKKSLLTVSITDKNNKPIPYNIIIVANDDLSKLENDFFSFNNTFSLFSGNYSIYATGSDPDYLMYKKIQLRKSDDKKVVLSLNETNKVKIPAEDTKGRKLFGSSDLTLGVYFNQSKAFVLSSGFIAEGNQTILVSNLTDENVDRNISFGFSGIHNPVCTESKCEYPESAISDSIWPEEYFLGWVFDDITSDVNLTYDLNKTQSYNYTFNYHTTTPLAEFFFIRWFNSPLHCGSNTIIPFSICSGGGSFPYGFTAPVNKSMLVFGPYIYSTDVSFLYDNYAVRESHPDFIHSSSPDAPDVIKPGYYKYNSPAYLPTYFTNSTKDSIEIKEWSLATHEGLAARSSLLPTMGIKLPDVVPTPIPTPIPNITPIPIIPIPVQPASSPSAGGFASFELWQRFSYGLFRNGTYVFNLTLPFGQEVWNTTILTAKIKYPSDDFIPPRLNSIYALPYFERNKNYSVTVNLTDESSLSNIKILYKLDDLEWNESSVSKNGDLYIASINVTGNDTKQVSLMINASDIKNNSIAYTVLPVSVKARIVNFNFKGNQSVVVPGETVAFKGKCTDDLGKSCMGLHVYYLLNGSAFGEDVTRFGLPLFIPFSRLPEISDGELSTEWTVPRDYPNVTVNFTLLFNGTGAYLPKVEDFGIKIAKPVDFKVKIRDKDGKPLKLDLEIIDDAGNTREKFDFSDIATSIPIGLWNIKIKSEKIEIKLNKVNISEDQNITIDFDDVPETVEPPPNTRLSEIVAANIQSNYSDASLSIKFNPFGFDESKLKLFKCGNWNFTAQRCESTWDVVNSNVDNTVTANVTSFSAYAVAQTLPFCGDGTCSDGETCSSCSRDCGNCPSAPSPSPGPPPAPPSPTPSPPSASFIPTCTRIGDACNFDSDCCTGFCINNVCQTGASLKVEKCMDNFELGEGESATTKLLIKNNGIITLNKISPKFVSLPSVSAGSVPSMIEKLSPGENFTFNISITMEKGNIYYTDAYYITAELSSRETNNRCTSKVVVKGRQDFDNLKAKIHELNKSLQDKESQGFYVEPARISLNGASEACGALNYEECLNKIIQTGEKLTFSAQITAVKQISENEPEVLLVLIVVELIILVPLVFYLIYRRKKKSKKKGEEEIFENI